MTEPLNLNDAETVARLRAVVRGQGLSMQAMSKELRERDAEIARLREVFDRTCKQHAEAMRGTCNTYQAEIAKLREVERRHLGWCDACLVYHRTGNCPVTGEPPSKEAREGWSLPTPQAPPGADVKVLAAKLCKDLDVTYPEQDGHAAPTAHGYKTAFCALQQYGDERAAAARAEWPPNTAEPTDPATGTPLDNEPALWLRNHWVYTQESALDAIRAAREAAISEAEAVADKYADNPVGDEKNNTAEAFAQGMDHQAGAVDNAIAIRDAIRALAAKPGSKPAETGQDVSDPPSPRKNP